MISYIINLYKFMHKVRNGKKKKKSDKRANELEDGWISNKKGKSENWLVNGLVL